MTVREINSNATPLRRVLTLQGGLYFYACHEFDGTCPDCKERTSISVIMVLSLN